jgi:hypothetical protein
VSQTILRRVRAGGSVPLHQAARLVGLNQAKLSNYETAVRQGASALDMVAPDRRRRIVVGTQEEATDIARRCSDKWVVWLSAGRSRRGKLSGMAGRDARAGARNVRDVRGRHARVGEPLG